MTTSLICEVLPFTIRLDEGGASIMSINTMRKIRAVCSITINYGLNRLVNAFGGAFNKTIGLVLLVVALPIFADFNRFSIIGETMGILSADVNRSVSSLILPVWLFQLFLLTLLQHNCIGWTNINAEHNYTVYASVWYRCSIQLFSWIRSCTQRRLSHYV